MAVRLVRLLFKDEWSDGGNDCPSAAVNDDGNGVH